MEPEREEELLRSAALQNAQAILAARRRAEDELVAAKEALRESEERLRAMFAQAAVGIAISNLDGTLAEVNAKFVEILGYPAGELPGVSAYDLSHPDDVQMTRDNVARLLSGQIHEYSYEKRYLRKDRSVVWTLTSVGLVRDPHGRPRQFIGVIEDITDQKRVQEENARLFEEREGLLERERAARAEAERMSLLKDEFLATLSHELRTPLAAILGWAQVLGRRTMTPDEVRRAVDVIERNARAQTRLIEDLLDMSRISSGLVRLDVQPVEPAAFIEAALETVRPAAEAKGVRLQKLLDPLAGPINGDPGRLQQVVWNLLTNAIKFTPRGGKVQVTLSRVDSHIEIDVTDTGIGIPAEFIGQVFDRFRQADSSTRRSHAGLGIGLSIAKQLVDLHGGALRAQSEGEGKGATFTLELPLTVLHRSRGAGERAHPAASGAGARAPLPDLSGVLVLAVDDEPDARELLRQVLQDCGATVLTAASVREAVAAVEREQIQVLVSDIGMPEADGYDLMRALRALPGGRGAIPAIALTAFARSEDRTRALRAGFRMHVSKPVEASELCAAVANAAGRG